MATFTIESAAYLAPDFNALTITMEIPPGGVAGQKYNQVPISNGIGTTNYSQTYTYESGTSITAQPLIWDPVNFTPDQFTINSITMNLGTGASGTLFYSGTTVPYTQTINSGSPTNIFNIMIDSFTSGSTDSSIDINITAEDTTSGKTETKSITILYLNT